MTTDTMTAKRIDARELADALKAANLAAKVASDESDDGGTCNMDSVVLRVPKGTRRSTIQAAAQLAGVPITETEWFGRGYFLALDARGQGNARTAGVQAARSALNARGFSATIYYQMD